MTTRRRNTSNIQKGLKDYMVPIIGGILILILIFSVFSGGDDSNKTVVNENQVGLDLELKGDNADAQIVYEGDYKNKIDSSTDLYKGEKLNIIEGYATIDFPGFGSLALNKNGELKYEEDSSLSLFSSDLFVNASNAIDVGMRFANVQISSDTQVSLSQNEVASTVYLLSGFVEVSNLKGNSTVLAPGQKLTVSRQDASNEEKDLSLDREPIDDFFKSTTWYIRNNGDSFLSGSDESGTGETLSGSIISNNSPVTTPNGLVTFDNLSDEDQVSNSKIDITGVYNDSQISKIEVNSRKANLNIDDNTFSLKAVDVSKDVNDLVIKIYGANDTLISKFVYTVYYGNSSIDSSASAGFNVKNYSLDANNFKFTSPSTTGTFTTSDDGQITIRGLVTDENVNSVKVNGYTLKSYNGSTWRYHASPINNNIKEGTNVYEVQYFSDDGTLLYTNNFTIVKRTQTGSNETNTFSEEAEI